MTASHRRENYLIILVALALGAQVAALLHQMRLIQLPYFSEELHPVGREVGEVRVKKRALTRRDSRSLSWYPLAEGDKVRVDESVMTGGDSEAKLEIFGKGEIELGPHSLIRLSEMSTDSGNLTLHLELDRGQVAVKTGGEGLKLKVKNREVRLAKNSVLEIQDSPLATDSRIEVKKGQASILSPARDLAATVKEGDLVALATQGAPMKMEIPKPLDVAPAATPMPMLPAIHYRLFSPGKSSKEGKPLQLRWEKIEGAVRYRLQISSQKDFKKLEVDHELSQTSWDWSPKKIGKYHWRIRAEHQEMGKWPYSPSRELTVKRLLKAPKTKGVKILKKKRSDRNMPTRDRRFSEWLMRSAWAAPSDEDLILEFSWEKEKGAKSYRLQVSDSASFDNILREVEVRNTSAVVELPAKVVYYWRVVALDDDGEMGAYSVGEKIVPPSEDPKVKESVKKKQAEPASPVALATPPSMMVKDEPVVRFQSVAAGISADYGVRGVRSTTLNVDESGLTYNRIHADTRFQIDRQSFRLSGWFQSLSYRTENTIIVGIHPQLRFTPFGVQFRADRLMMVGAQPLMFGVAYHQEADYVLAAEDTVTLQAASFIPLMFGHRFLDWLEVWAEGSFWSAWRGLGLLVEARFEIPLREFFFTPEVLLAVKPSLRFKDGKTYSRVDFSAQLSAKWDWD